MSRHIVRPSVPRIVTRAFDAFAANDATEVGEAFTTDSFLVSHTDAALLARLGMPEDGPVRCAGSLGIANFFQAEMDLMQITAVETHSEMRVGRELAAIVDFDARILSTGDTVSGRCMGIYTLNPAGKRIVRAKTVCKLFTPGWNFPFN